MIEYKYKTERSKKKYVCTVCDSNFYVHQEHGEPDMCPFDHGNEEYLTNPGERKVYRVLSENEKMSHGELAKKSGFDLRELQEIIRKLRNKGMVVMTTDRRFEVASE